MPPYAHYVLLSLRLPSNLEARCKDIQCRMPFQPLLPPLLPLRWVAAPLSISSLQQLRKRQVLGLYSGELQCDDKGFLWLACSTNDCSVLEARLPAAIPESLFPDISQRKEAGVFLGIDATGVVLPKAPRMHTEALWLTQVEFLVYTNPWWEGFRWKISFSRRMTVRQDP